MSCEAGANRIARWASQVGAGIAQLANKRAFYAGMGLGGAGLLGAGLIALARRQSAGRRNKKERRNKESQEQMMMRPIPQLPTRLKIGPTSYLSSSDRCVGCQTPGTGKQGAWYSINGRTYCQDCAPAAARQANVDLVAPAREVAGARGAATVTAGPSGEGVRIPVRRGGPVSSRLSLPPYLPPERRVETRLAQSRLRLNVGQDPNGQPAWFVVNKGHVILRSDGSDTGLAITPALKLGQVKEGFQEVEEDTGRWWLTHIPSGKTLGHRPYASLAEAQLLGSVLAQLDWTRPENEISDQEITQVSETIRRYNQALGQEKAGAEVKAEVKEQSWSPQPSPQPQPESLVGQLMADNYGGVARVLDVTPDGETLLMIDSLGKRYEVGRDEVRLPTAGDFEMCRVGMSFDPAKQPEAHCARCHQPASNAEGGKWYRMGWKNFCPSCATEYAAEEGYLKDDEIHSELESMG
jgi:hypothetical protein